MDNVVYKFVFINLNSKLNPSVMRHFGATVSQVELWYNIIYCGYSKQRSEERSL